MSRFPRGLVTHRDKSSRLPKGMDRRIDNNRLIDEMATKIIKAWRKIQHCFKELMGQDY